MSEPASKDEPYFSFSATLRIFGSIPDLGCVSALLDLEPTHTHQEGERRGSLSPPYKHDMWSYKAPIAEDRPLDEHIQSLWSKLSSRKVELLTLKEICSVDVFCGYRSNVGTAGFEVSAKSLEMFVALQIPFGVSVILA